MTPTLELGEGNVSIFAKFKYERGSSKTGCVFEKNKHNFPFPFYKVRQPSQLEVKFMLKIITLGEKEDLIILPKDLKHDRPGAGVDKQ